MAYAGVGEERGISMGKSTKVKIFFIVALVVAAVCTAIGVMAHSGLFQSDRTEAMKLLLQASEQLTWSATDNYIGSKKMTGELLKEGGQFDISISDLNPGDGIWKEILGSSDGPSSLFRTGAGVAAGWEGISDYTFNWNQKIDNSSGRTSNAVSIAKGEEKISYISCQDEDEDWIALPELLEGKVFHITAKEKSDMFGEHISGNNSTDIKDALSFLQDLEAFLIESSVEMQKEMLFDKIPSASLRETELNYIWDEGYEAVIPKETVNTFLQDFAEMLQKQELFASIGESAKNWSVAQDIILKIYGEEGRLGSIETEIPIAGEMYDFSLDFSTDENGKSMVTFFCKGEIGGEACTLAIKKSDKTKDTCETAFDIELLEGETSLLHLVFREQVSPYDGSYQMNINWDDAEGNKYGIRAKGSIKDLKKGSCVSYILDDIEVTSNDAALFTMAVKYQLTAGSTEVIPPAGDTVEITSDTKDEDMEQYRTEIMKNLNDSISRMGMLGNIFSDGGLL